MSSLSIEYLKKARGRLVAEARITIPAVTAPIDHRVEATITDESGDAVARATVLWRLGPV
mgnify:CR=1 FL=1